MVEASAVMFESAAARAGLDELMDAVRAGMQVIAEAQEKRAKLTAVASEAGSRVTVTVNADGIVVETQFASDIDELGYNEIAVAVTKAAQRAAADVRAQSDSLMAAASQGFGGIPESDDMAADLPDFVKLIPIVPEASPTSPASDDEAW
ncbi:YbaB/EbfC family nucleoid-associated protein [Nocardia sp. NPDC004604]|uniref:YbaB/EbfC family nucleoid-associated protein n=1 Tax=Nocardia sp. NPDC004604 TaxID=3157013 RepID=UPI0033BCC78E